MNWFHLLKVQRQTQRQGVSARQKDEEFIFEDEDNTCYEKLLDFVLSQYPKKEEYRSVLYFTLDQTEDIVSVNTPSAFGRSYNEIKDEYYCQVLDHFKSINLDELTRRTVRIRERVKEKKISPNVKMRYLVRYLENEPSIIRISYLAMNSSGKTIWGSLLTYQTFFNPESLEGRT